MGRVFVLLIAAWALLAAGCAGSPTADGTAPAAQTPGATPVAASEAPRQDGSSRPGGQSTAGQYPIAPGIWYPGDGPLPEHLFKYYRVRCWPGCHDPNSAPQPHP
jgi:hypothetical protein